jgi:hypothetical protein
MYVFCSMRSELCFIYLAVMVFLARDLVIFEVCYCIFYFAHSGDSVHSCACRLLFRSVLGYFCHFYSPLMDLKSILPICW